jgi:hypothetical protein
MAVSVTVAGVTYSVPTTNEELWGINTTDYLVALGEELANVVVEGDISPETLVNIPASGSGNVTDFIIDGNLIQSAQAEYYIQRQSDSPLEVGESGTLHLLFNDTLGTWSFAQVGNNIGASLVTFSMSGNQLQFTAAALPSGVYIEGKMRFRVRALPK